MFGEIMAKNCTTIIKQNIQRAQQTSFGTNAKKSREQKLPGQCHWSYEKYSETKARKANDNPKKKKLKMGTTNLLVFEFDLMHSHPSTEVNLRL